MTKKLHHTASSVTAHHQLWINEVRITGYAYYSEDPDKESILVVVHEFNEAGKLVVKFAIENERDYKGVVPPIPEELKSAMEGWQRLAKQVEAGEPG